MHNNMPTVAERGGQKMMNFELRSRGQGASFKMKGVQAINWLMYELYCRREGLAQGNFKNFKKYMEDRI